MADSALPRGRLFVVGTPIGNLGDLTGRAGDVLGRVGIVAAEDTRRTRKLLSHLGIQARLMSCREHNEVDAAVRLIEQLAAGVDVALVTDAGTPALSDPGARLVGLVHKAGYAVVTVPGVSAITTALSVAGLPADTFFFGGFLPGRTAARRKTLEALAGFPHTLVFFEAPHRLSDALEDILDILGDRRALLARELTKVHETLIAGRVGDLLLAVAGSQVRGEITLVIAGADVRVETEGARDPEALKRALDAMTVGAGLPLREAVDVLASLTGLPRRHVYQAALAGRQEGTS